MSTNSALKARLARLGPVRGAAPPRSFSGAPVMLVLRRTGRFAQRIAVAERLRAAGLSLQAAHATITRLAGTGLAVCVVAEGADIPALAHDLAALDVRVWRERGPDAGAAGFIAGVRARHGLSQREFAAVLGIDPATLQNWEQGRNKPDPAALALIRAFDAAPEIVSAAALEPAG